MPAGCDGIDCAGRAGVQEGRDGIENALVPRVRLERAMQSFRACMQCLRAVPAGRDGIERRMICQLHGLLGGPRAIALPAYVIRGPGCEMRFRTAWPRGAAFRSPAPYDTWV
jgi:hypothetical protein